MIITNCKNNVPDVNVSADVHTSFDRLYDTMTGLLDKFYPLRRITVTSSDPSFVSPVIKAMLRRKNRLMKSGRVGEAGALARRVRVAITNHSKISLRDVDKRKWAQKAWTRVREVLGTGAKYDETVAAGNLTAKSINDHYASISVDNEYRQPARKLTAPDQWEFVSEARVFHLLNKLQPTAAGLDNIPAWFLRLGASV